MILTLSGVLPLVEETRIRPGTAASAGVAMMASDPISPTTTATARPMKRVVRVFEMASMPAAAAPIAALRTPAASGLAHDNTHDYHSFTVASWTWLPPWCPNLSLIGAPGLTLESRWAGCSG